MDEKIVKVLYTDRMGLETIFYTLGIVTMILSIVIMISFIALLFTIKNKIQNAKNSVGAKVMGLVKERNTEILSAIGITIVGMFLDKFKNKKS